MPSETEAPIPTVNVFWSMRSPYCYISLDRCIEMQKKYNMELILRPVWPLAFWNPDWFDAAQRMKYRAPYQDLDTVRSAQFHGMPFMYPNPDPILQEGGVHGKIAPLEKQTIIRPITHAAADVFGILRYRQHDDLDGGTCAGDALRDVKAPPGMLT